MKNSIKQFLQEVLDQQIETRIKTYYESLKNVIQTNYPFIDLKYQLPKENKPGSLEISIKNNFLNLKEITNFLREKMEFLRNIHSVANRPDLYSNWSFHPDVLENFLNTEYIKNKKDLLDNLNLNPSLFLHDFDGDKSEKLEKRIENVKNFRSTDIQDQIIQYVKGKTDAPLDVKIKLTNAGKKFLITLTPNITVSDLISCKYKKWDFPDEFWGFKYDIRKDLFSDVPFDSLELKVEILWPRTVGSFLVKLNEKLRNSLPNDIRQKYGIRVDLDLCLKTPKIIVGSEHGSDIPEVDRKIIRNIVRSIGLDNSEILFWEGRDWYGKNAYLPDDINYWTKEQLFDFFVTKSVEKHGKIYEYSIDRFIDLDKPAEVFCKKHGTWFSINPKQHIKGKKCPFDNESSGENLVRVFLEEKNINFTQYYRFDKCVSEVNNRCYKLPFDFYLPDYNILIEYDGEQHYKPIKIWGGEEGFERQQKLDLIKNKFAVDNNINLIRIPYKVKKVEDLKKYLPNDLFKK
jgi:hypothetical protein